MDTVLADVLTEKRLRGFALIFDRFEKTSTFVFNLFFSEVPVRWCRPPCCCSSPWPTCLIHEKFWPKSENGPCSWTWFWFPLRTYIANNWLWLPTRAQFWCSLEANFSGPMIFHLLQSVFTTSLSINLFPIVFRHEILSDFNVVKNPASVQILITRLRCDSLSTRSWYLCNGSSCAKSSAEGVGVIVNKLAGANRGQICLTKTSLPILTWQDLYSSHKSDTAPQILNWWTETIVRNTVLFISPSAQKCINNFPPLLRLSVPRDNGLVARKTWCPLSLNFININSATLSHSPCGLSL